MTTTLPKPFATQLRHEIEYGDNGMVRKFLVKDQKRHAMLICLRSGIQIPEHTSAHDSFITVIQGQGVFLLAGQEIALEPGVFIELPANTLHALAVTEDLAMLKVVDNHEPKEFQGGMKKACQESARDRHPRQATCAEVLAEMLKPYLQEPVTTALRFPELLQEEAAP